jgi:small subunit ribosomal protein S10
MKIYFKLKSYHPIYLENFCKEANNLAQSTFNKKLSQVNLPKKTERFTVLKSPHVDKKARDQFERITYKRLMVLDAISADKIQILIKKFVQISVGISMEVKFIV